MNGKLVARLKDFGYEYNSETDAGLLQFCTDSVENKIKNRINQSVIPEELEEVEIDMICGNFLGVKKSCGQLDSYNFEQAVQSIKEGDTQVTFASGLSPEQQFDALINSMTNGHEEDFIRFRKLVW